MNYNFSGETKASLEKDVERLGKIKEAVKKRSEKLMAEKDEYHNRIGRYNTTLALINENIKKKEDSIERNVLAYDACLDRIHGFDKNDKHVNGLYDNIKNLQKEIDKIKTNTRKTTLNRKRFDNTQSNWASERERPGFFRSIYRTFKRHRANVTADRNNALASSNLTMERLKDKLNDEKKLLLTLKKEKNEMLPELAVLKKNKKAIEEDIEKYKTYKTRLEEDNKILIGEEDDLEKQIEEATTKIKSIKNESPSGFPQNTGPIGKRLEPTLYNAAVKAKENAAEEAKQKADAAAAAAAAAYKKYKEASKKFGSFFTRFFPGSEESRAKSRSRVAELKKEAEEAEKEAKKMAEEAKKAAEEAKKAAKNATAPPAGPGDDESSDDESTDDDNTNDEGNNSNGGSTKGGSRRKKRSNKKTRRRH